MMSRQIFFMGKVFYFKQLGSAVTKELEKAGVSSPEALDKSYWIQRVGEVKCVCE